MGSSICFSRAKFTMACPRGCSDICSHAPAIFSSSSSLPSGHFPTATTSVTLGLPSVMVPVLSRITASTLWQISNASPLLIRIPWPAPTPVPTMMAVGVASPSAQGQAITSTATKIVSTKARSRPPNIHQARADTRAIAITAGTK